MGNPGNHVQKTITAQFDKMKISINLTTLITTFVMALAFASTNARNPNIVVIMTDDQGYADISYNPRHAKEVSTPHMDRLAKEGVFFSQAYTSGVVCSPTRAGLMLGRYQQRVGIYTAGEGGNGFDPNMKIFPSYCRKNTRAWRSENGTLGSMPISLSSNGTP